MTTTSACSARSLAAGEALFASAPRTDAWLLLECPRPWGPKAPGDSTLPEPVKQRLNDWMKAIPHTRLQLLEQHALAPDAPLAFYVAVVRERPALYRFTLAHYTDLLDLDVPALVGGTAGAAAHAVAEPLFVACVNQERDNCCGRLGPPVYHALRDAAGAAAWMGTHVGGHRFAPNVTCFPHGLQYGRFTPADVPRIVAAYRAGAVVLEFARGRGCYDAPVQAAEHFVRQATGIVALDALRLAGVRQKGDTWTVTFAAGRDTRTVRVGLAPERLALVESCNGDKVAQIAQYRLV
jgi:hypothetical protein